MSPKDINQIRQGVDHLYHLNLKILIFFLLLLIILSFDISIDNLFLLDFRFHLYF